MWVNLVKSQLSRLRQLLIAESPFKMMKNTFYFMLISLFVLKMFVSKISSKFMTSQTGKQIITVHILPNISRSKGNEAMNLVS